MNGVARMREHPTGEEVNCAGCARTSPERMYTPAGGEVGFAECAR